jgi:hypothetical protein
MARVRITVLFLTATASLMLAAPGRLPAQDEPGAPRTSITEEQVNDTVDALVGEGDYKYNIDEVEDPTWLVWLTEMLRKLDERWQNSPLNSHGRMSAFGILGLFLVVLIVITSIGMVFSRVFGASGRRRISTGETETGFDWVSPDGWSDAGSRKAAELAASGRLREASSLLFRALLHGLDSSGWIRFHKGRASRAYLRQLRRSDQLYPLFRDFLWCFEQAFYRKQEPSGEDWEFLHSSYQSLSNTARNLRPPAYMRQA